MYGEVFVGTVKSFKSINIFFPIKGKKSSVSQQRKVCFYGLSCKDVSSRSVYCVYVAMFNLNQSQDSLSFLWPLMLLHI